MDTLYTLCHSADHRCGLPLKPTDVAEIIVCKKAYFEAEAKENALVKEVLKNGSVTYEGMEADDKRGFLAGPATFFRIHEILRKTRSRNAPIKVGGVEYPHNEVATMFDRCIPNVKLHHIPWFSLAHYRMSLGLAWGMTLLTAHIVARDAHKTVPLDGFVLYHMGIVTTIAALIYTALRQNRDVRRTAPWNSAIYLDLNMDLMRRDMPALAVAWKEFLPQQKLFKTPEFYYALARRIESHGFDDELKARL